MKIKNVLIREPGVKVIDIDTGAVKNLVAGRTYDVEPVEHKDRDYYVLAGTRQGSISRFWEDLERDGRGELRFAREDTDPVIDGVRLPITARAQLTDWQYRHLVIGKLVKGKFRCNDCAGAAGRVYPEAIDIMPVHVLPYSQKCGSCGLQIVAIWRSAKGGWLNLHD